MTVQVTTPCATLCDADCELGTAGCHERHQPASKRLHDPDGCERTRAALDEHSRLCEELELDNLCRLSRVEEERLKALRDYKA